MVAPHPFSIINFFVFSALRRISAAFSRRNHVERNVRPANNAYLRHTDEPCGELFSCENPVVIPYLYPPQETIGSPSAPAHLGYMNLLVCKREALTLKQIVGRHVSVGIGRHTQVFACMLTTKGTVPA